MNKNSKIYIAGHRGLVGSAILRKLKEEGFSNLIVKTSRELDLTDQKSVEEFFKTNRPEYIFLSAAKVGGIYANETYPADFIYNNLQIQNNVIHQSYLSGVKKLLFLGSSCIYPKLCLQPIKEEYLLTSRLEETNEAYAIAKIAGLKMCKFYRKQYGCNFISVMPTNLYGENDNFDLETSHVLPALIRKIHLAKLFEQKKWDEIKKDLLGTKVIIDNKTIIITKETQKADIIRTLNHYGIRSKTQNSTPRTQNTKPKTQNATLSLWGTGTPKREFLYIDDFAEGLLFLMKNYDEAEHINIGCGVDLSIKELSIMVKNIIDFKGDVIFDKSLLDGTPQKLLDISKLKKLGFRHKIFLDEGIKKTYEWYLNKTRSFY